MKKVLIPIVIVVLVGVAGVGAYLRFGANCAQGARGADGAMTARSIQIGGRFPGAGPNCHLGQGTGAGARVGRQHDELDPLTTMRLGIVKAGH
jgi:hypothetical protein